MTVPIGINGAAGRMGRRLMALAAEDDALDLAEAVDAPGCPLIGSTARDLAPESESDVVLADAFSGKAKVIVDFSLPEGTVAVLDQAVSHGAAMVIGTTGLDDAQLDAVREASGSVAVVHAANMSLGVNLLLRVAAEVAKALGEDFDIEIVESHHNRKADAPSGTALALANSVCEALGREPSETLVHGREGRTGARTKQEIGMHALRMGAVVGEHTLHFAGDVERIELTHRAQTRDVFAAGALRAAAWVADREPGLYSMQDVLF